MVLERDKYAATGKLYFSKFSYDLEAVLPFSMIGTTVMQH